ncbi:MAG: DNA recombination protein RmuC [Rickettsia sp.]|nr:DNA recombination protein RmuC [Rickettsia sp.]
MIFLFYTIFTLSIGFNLYFFYKIISLRAALLFSNQKLSESEFSRSNLEKFRLEDLQKIERFSSQLELKDKMISEYQTSKEQFLEESKKTLADLGNKLGKELIDIHRQETKESRELSENNISKASEKFNQEFIKIANMVSNLDKDVNESKNSVNFIKTSLLSPSSFGQLAEITLENILKSSGLKRGVDFVVQYSIMGDGLNKLRPDAVVFLPGNNIMLIDAKSSTFLIKEENQKFLLKSINNHLKSLVKKDYAEVAFQELSKKSFKVNNIMTIMFLPTEQSIEKISNLDQEFLRKSWEMNIFPVGPVGLMNMLSLTKFHISEQKMLDNYDQIISEIKKLLSSITILSGHIDKLESNLTNMNNNFQKFLGSFNGNFLRRVDKISILGLSKSQSVQTNLTEVI